MNKFLSLLLVVVAIAQASAFMGTPVFAAQKVRWLCVLCWLMGPLKLPQKDEIFSGSLCPTQATL